MWEFQRPYILTSDREGYFWQMMRLGTRPLMTSREM